MTNYLFYLCTAMLITLVTPLNRCTASQHGFEKYLGTKSPYRNVANFNSSEIKIEGCEATKIWSLVRHGTRNPNLKLIERMKTRLPEIRDAILENISGATSEIPNSDLDRFRTWSFKLTEKDEKKLTHEGEDEMLLLAERMQKRFPNILKPVYSQSAYNFKFTATQRTKKSAQHFAAGLFGKNVVKDIDFPQPLKRDPVLRFYKLCSKWRLEVSKNPDAIVERHKFENGSHMSQVISRLNKRLGFTDELDYVDVYTMYMACAFETSWNKRKKSPWCSIFTIDEIKVIEYSEDLKYYWVDGYGHELTYKQACAAITDLLEMFNNESSLPKATFYFTHSGTLLKTLAYLQLYKDKKPLLAEDFLKNDNRKWRVSEIDAFGTNLAFILFKCRGQNKILTLHQENIIRLPSCPDSDLCDIKKFVKYYTKGQECDFEEMCAVE